jgi:putative membrane protein
MKLLVRFLLLTAVVFALPYVVTGISVANLVVAFIVALIFAFVNTVIKPIISLLALPINILTLGLFSFIINGLLFWGISAIVSGFRIDTFIAAVIGSFVLSVASWFFGLFLD